MSPVIRLTRKSCPVSGSGPSMTCSGWDGRHDLCVGADQPGGPGQQRDLEVHVSRHRGAAPARPRRDPAGQGAFVVAVPPGIRQVSGLTGAPGPARPECPLPPRPGICEQQHLAGESSGQLPGTGVRVDTAEGTGLGVLFLVGTGTGVLFPDGTATGVRVADGTGTGVLTLVGTGAGVRAPVLEGTGTGLLTLDGTGVGVQSGQVGEGDGDGWRAVGVGEGPAGAGVIAPLGTGTGVAALVGTGAGVAQPGPPAVWWAPAECLPADCAEAESSRAAGGWLELADATASPTPPRPAGRRRPVPARPSCACQVSSC